MNALDIIAMARSGKGGGDVTKAYVDEQISDVRDDIPTKTSDLTNDSNFVTNQINDTAASASTTYSSDKVESAYPITSTSTTSPIIDSADGLIQDVKVYGKSRASKNLISSWEQGIINKDDGIAIEANNYWTYTPNYIPISSFDYVLSMNTTSYSRVFYYNENKGFITYSQPFLNSREYVINTAMRPVNAKYIRISFNLNGTSVAITPEDMPTYQVQLELGSEPTPYEPYFSGIRGIGEDGELEITTANSDNTASTTAAVTTGIPLYAVGDVKDELDEKRGVAIKRCKKVSLPELSWEYVSAFGVFIASLPINAKSSVYGLCNLYQFVDVAGWGAMPDKTIAIRPEIFDRIGVKDARYSDVASFVAAISEGDFVYPIAEPVELPLTASEITQLRGLKTYNPTTNITITDNPDFEINYLKKSKNGQAVADLQTELQKQISYYVAGQAKQNAILNHTYLGEALTDLFANEIQADYDNAWQWITARTSADNFNGINVADFIPTTIKTYSLNPQIAGIITYTGYGDTAVGKHIDWISKEVYPELHAVNKVNFNNGTAEQNHPWLASDLYHWLNSLSGTVPNEAVVGGGAGEAVDYTADGVYYNLPAELKAAIIEKRFLLPTRYSASGLLTDDNSWAWKNIGKLWLPDECEVYGMPVWGGKGGYSLGGSVLQYPLFAGNMNRLKFRNGSRNYWWLLSPYSDNFTHWCYVGYDGGCSYGNASSSNIAVPVCFRTGTTYAT